MTTYECEICLNINHASKLHCSTCGAVPAKYSILGVTSRAIEHDSFIDAGLTFNYMIPFVIAHGADRAEHHRTVRTYLRTVKLDYYATA